MSCSGEEWKPVVGFEGLYEVSNAGNVRRIMRKLVGYSYLKPLKTSCNYYRVCLFNNSRRKYVHIHRIVMRAFVGVLPEGMQVNHKDGNKANNRLENLEYVTAVENTHHACKTGLRYHRFTDALIYELLSQRNKVSQCELGRRYGISQGQVSQLFSGKIWKSQIWKSQVKAFNDKQVV